MKKLLSFVVLIAFLLAFILTGCFDNSGNKDTTHENGAASGSNEYTMSYSELFSDVTWDDNYQNLTLNSYKDGDTINIVDTVIYSQYNPDYSPNPLTVVAFGDEFLGLYLVGNKTSMYPAGSIVTIETKVKEYTLTEGKKSILLENWWLVYISGMMGSSSNQIMLEFLQDIQKGQLMVKATDVDLLWTDFHIDGICDTSNLVTYVEPGDIISDCTGIISVTYIPNNQLVGTWYFN